MKDIIIIIGMAVMFFALVVAFGWVIYRAVKGSDGDSYSIK